MCQHHGRVPARKTIVIKPLRWIRIVALWVFTILALTGAARDAEASTLTASVAPTPPGNLAVPTPVRVALRATLTAAPPGAPRPQLRMLTLAMPDGFSTDLAGVSACDLASVANHRCLPASKLGGGRADFDADTPLGRMSGATHELSIFRTGDTTIAAYARITEPAEKHIVLPGILIAQPAPAGPLLTLDLDRITKLGQATVFVTRAAFTLGRGLAAGTCPPPAWTFRMHLEFMNGAPEDPLPALAPCVTSPATVPSATPPPATPPPATTPLDLQVSVKSGRRAAGARFAISVSEPATVTIVLRRRVGGRWVLVRRRSLPRPLGRSVVTVHRPHRHGLPAGRYHAVVGAVGASGATASKVRDFRLR
jgi:hypothetical protein